MTFIPLDFTFKGYNHKRIAGGWAGLDRELTIHVRQLAFSASPNAADLASKKLVELADNRDVHPE
jgi:hypothetical protein